MMKARPVTLLQVTQGPSPFAAFPAAVFSSKDTGFPPVLLAQIADQLLQPLGFDCSVRISGNTLAIPCPRSDLAPVIEGALNALISAAPSTRSEAASSAIGVLLACWWNPREAAMLAQAALTRNIPVHWPNHDGSHLALGNGRFRRHYRAGYTDHDPARQVTDDKAATATALAEMGLQVPGGQAVSSMCKALETAESLGFPVVLKPQQGAAQKSIFVGLRDAATLTAAWHNAKAQNPATQSFMVERYIEGGYVRATLVGGSLAAYATNTPFARGDGVMTAGALAAREMGFATAFETCPPDGQEHISNVLAPQALSPGSIPADGQIFAAGYASDGVAEDVTKRLHPDTRSALTRIAARFPSPALGIDLLLPKPSAPLCPPAAVIEVNSAPGFAIHEDLCPGTGSTLANALLDVLFPGPVRVPVLAYPAENPTLLTPFLEALAKAGLNAGGKTGETYWFDTPNQMLNNTDSIDRLFDRADLALFCLGLEPQPDIGGLPVGQIDTTVGEGTAARVAEYQIMPSAGQVSPADLVALAQNGIRE